MLLCILNIALNVEKSNFTISKEVDSVEWVPFTNALEKVREGSISWKLIKEVI
ncbi:MAG: hypothetical protein ACRC2K_07965 [Clostridium sp.]